MLVGCSDNLETMVGTVDEVRIEQNELLLDVSDWVIEEKDVQNAIGYIYVAEIGKDTVVQTEHGEKVKWQNLKVGQKVKVKAPEGTKEHGAARKIVILKMTRKEKLGYLVPKAENQLNVVVLYSPAGPPSEKLENEVMELIEGFHIQVVARLYDPDYVIDLKKAFEIRKWPIILAFDANGLAFKTQNVEELRDFLQKYRN